MPTLSTNGITLAYEITGTGQPLVLISGVGYGAWYWNTLVPHLATRYQVITFDNRGAGASDKPAGPYSIPMLTADLAGLLDGLQLRQVYVLGHSLGGFIAQELAVTRPELVGKLILASTNHGGMKIVPITPAAMQVMLDRSGDPLELIRRGIALAAAPGFADRHPETVQTLIDYRLTNPVPPPQYTAQVMAGAGMSAFTEAQVAERLAAIRVPVLVLFGEADQVVPPGNAGLLADKLPNARITILPNTGHIFTLEDPSTAAQVILDFLG